MQKKHEFGLVTARTKLEAKNIANWEIELIPDNNFIEENNYPDWYGYQKIDGI